MCTCPRGLRRSHRLRRMGRRSRRGTNPGTPAPTRDHQARVKVSDDVWADFRAATRNSSVSVALGDLVTREVDRYRARRVREGSADEQELMEALERAHE